MNCKEEEVLDDQQVCNQERNSSLDQQDSKPPQIKEEQEELCINQQREQLVVKQEAEGIIFWTGEERLRLLDTIWKPEINSLHRSEHYVGRSKCDDADWTLYVTEEASGMASRKSKCIFKQSSCPSDFPQQKDFNEEKGLDGQQVCNQERNPSLGQEDPEPPQIKEEQEELCTSQEREHLTLKQETDTFMVTPAYEECKPEPNSDLLLSHNSPESEGQDQGESKHVDSGSTRRAEPIKRRRRGNRVNDSPGSESQCKTSASKKCLKCETCGKTFQFKSGLTEHLRVHTGEKPYYCTTCGKRFSFSSAFKVHMRIHTGEKPYPCTTCGKRFRDLKSFKTHMRIHTGEKPYSCSICGKQFRDLSGFRKHTRIHTGERPYVCGMCEKRFSQMIHLKTHTRIHTGEKPLSSSACGKTFKQTTQLKRHMRIHTG